MLDHETPYPLRVWGLLLAVAWRHAFDTQFRWPPESEGTRGAECSSNKFRQGLPPTSVVVWPRYLHASVLGLPAIDGLLRHAILPVQLVYTHATFIGLEDGDDMLCGMEDTLQREISCYLGKRSGHLTFPVDRLLARKSVFSKTRALLENAGVIIQKGYTMILPFWPNRQY